MKVKAIIWKSVPGLEHYEVSNCGDLRIALNSDRRGAGRRLRGFVDVDGYIRYSLTDTDGKSLNKSAHALVAMAFLGPKPSITHEVAHNNGSRLCNIVENLRWATRRQNDADRRRHGTDPRGTRNGRATITEDDVRYIRRRYRELKTLRLPVAELDKKFSLCRAQIIRIAQGQAWRHVQ